MWLHIMKKSCRLSKQNCSERLSTIRTDKKRTSNNLDCDSTNTTNDSWYQGTLFYQYFLPKIHPSNSLDVPFSFKHYLFTPLIQFDIIDIRAPDHLLHYVHTYKIWGTGNIYSKTNSLSDSGFFLKIFVAWFFGNMHWIYTYFVILVF